MKSPWEVVPSGITGGAYRVRRKDTLGNHDVIYDTQNVLTLRQAEAIAVALNALEDPVAGG